jgi:pimeloyl-ACP methyl ester carboxylesterase
VLVHGWGGSFTRTWQATGFTALLDDAGKHVIGVDLLGHGTAPKPHQPDAYADLTTRVAAALPDHPVAAIGFSLGAITLLRLAAREPQRFERILLAGLGDATLRHDADGQRLIVDALEAPSEAVAELPVIGRLFRQYAEQPGNDLAALTAVIKRPPATPLAELDLSVVTCPVLFVIGDRDHSGPAEKLPTLLPNASVVTLRNVDHFALTEAFGFIDASLDFVD